MWGLVLPQVCESRAISTMQKANNGTVMFQVIVACILTCKGAITEVILIYDLNAIKYLHGDAKFSRGILHGDSEFSREFCMGMPNSLFGGGYQKH